MTPKIHANIIDFCPEHNKGFFAELVMKLVHGLGSINKSGGVDKHLLRVVFDYNISHI